MRIIPVTTSFSVNTKGAFETREIVLPNNARRILGISTIVQELGDDIITPLHLTGTTSDFSALTDTLSIHHYESSCFVFEVNVPLNSYAVYACNKNTPIKYVSIDNVEGGFREPLLIGELLVYISEQSGLGVTTIKVK